MLLAWYADRPEVKEWQDKVGRDGGMEGWKEDVFMCLCLCFCVSKDCGVTTKEAEKMLLAWYADRPDVKEWQEKVREGDREGGREGGRESEIPTNDWVSYSCSLSPLKSSSKEVL